MRAAYALLRAIASPSKTPFLCYAGVPGGWYRGEAQPVVMIYIHTTIKKVSFT